MMKQNRHQLKILNILSDAALIFASYILAVFLRFRVLNAVAAVEHMSGTILMWVGILSLLLPLGYYAVRPQQHAEGTGYAAEYAAIAAVNAVGAVLVMAGFFICRLVDISRLGLLLFWLFSTSFVILKHVVGRIIILHYRSLGYQKHHVLIVGNGKHAQQYARNVCADATSPYSLEGFISLKKPDCPELGPWLGCYEDIDRVLEERNPDDIVIALESHEVSFMPQIISAAERSGAYVSLIPFFSEYYPTHPEIETYGDSKLINLRATPLDKFGNEFLKRLVDIVGSLFLIILSSPLMLISVVGVKLSSPGPIFFRQERVGKDRKTFQMLKFRSMRVNAKETTGWSKDVDPRRTKFGSFIRKYSIDELPQFFNVLKGDMSLVGPRPEIPFYVHQFKETVPLYLVRQQAKPGITGWAQIHGLRGDTSIEDRVEYDIWYIENWSLWLDLKILFITLFGGKFKNNEK